MKALDKSLIDMCADALENGEPVRAQVPIRNVNRTVGTMLGSEVTARFGADGLPTDTIDITFTGSAGQSFGAFVPRGITLRLEGDVNDYLGRGLSGGRLIVRPDRAAQFEAEQHIVQEMSSRTARHPVDFGARQGGRAVLCSQLRSDCRCGGAGDHLCEYMTGGRVVVLGEVGRNVAARHVRGIAYLLDLDEEVVNRDMVDVEALSEGDREFLFETVGKHAAETGSVVAENLLAEWDQQVDRFGRSCLATTSGCWKQSPRPRALAKTWTKQ